MNFDRWKRLITAVRNDLPFAPAYQLKNFDHPASPDNFDDEVNYIGDWSDECLFPYDDIEWIKIKPRTLKHVGRLVPNVIISVEEQVLNILHEQKITYVYDKGNIIIYGKRKCS